MPRTHGFNWDDTAKDRLRDLKIQAYTNFEIVDILTKEYKQPITIKMIEQAVYRYRLISHLISAAEGITYYKDESVPDGNYMVFSDAHAPYYDEVYLNRMMAIADKFGIVKGIAAGDTLDMNFAKYFYDSERGDLDAEIIKTTPLFQALQYFDEVIFLQGNHENRIGRMTDGKVQARHIFKIFGEKVWVEKFKYIENKTRIKVGRKWLITHPTSYSQISASVSVRLAEKYHRNIINAHGHFIAFRWDRSGKYQCYDLGGLFNVAKIKYTSESTTTHPEWNQGFMALLDGHAYHFHGGTDWKYWLGR